MFDDIELITLLLQSRRLALRYVKTSVAHKLSLGDIFLENMTEVEGQLLHLLADISLVFLRHD